MRDEGKKRRNRSCCGMRARRRRGRGKRAIKGKESGGGEEARELGLQGRVSRDGVVSGFRQSPQTRWLAGTWGGWSLSMMTPRDKILGLGKDSRVQFYCPIVSNNKNGVILAIQVGYAVTASLGSSRWNCAFSDPT
ncbi:hypothetical protein CC78DRAFT_42701 [Lojkania enalia]|uniref:Uncharacterized protein n=1 Tax=Lojkania enalia TaxID=147567 RepID=A0A9P4K1Y5_9PLEO|nr:hypothetical protein CC78DRAFT_42701 [Didymosphaeria enalia]